jgi:hypothetical protein
MANLEQANEYQHSPNSQLIDRVEAPNRRNRGYSSLDDAEFSAPGSEAELAENESGTVPGDQ